MFVDLSPLWGEIHQIKKRLTEIDQKFKSFISAIVEPVIRKKHNLVMEYVTQLQERVINLKVDDTEQRQLIGALDKRITELESTTVYPEPESRIGETWTVKEDKYLRKAFNEFVGHQAKLMGRSELGIFYRVRDKVIRPKEN